MQKLLEVNNGRQAVPTILIGKQKFLGFAQNQVEIKKALRSNGSKLRNLVKNLFAR